MSYATLDDLAARASLDDLAVRAAPDRATVDGPLLRLALDGIAAGRSLDKVLEGLKAETGEGGIPVHDPADVDALRPAVGRLQRALDDAKAEIDGWIGARYPNLAWAPASLATYAADIALYRLRVGADEEQRQHAYDAACRWLKAVAIGQVDLEAPAPDPDVDEGPWGEAPQGVFTRGDAFRGYV